MLAVALAAGLVREPWKRASVDDLVASLGSEPAAPVRDALALALGDPSLRVGYWLDDAAAYVDAGETASSCRRRAPAGARRGSIVPERPWP